MEMNIMKRIVSMLLALMVSLAMPVTAFATKAPSISTPQTGDASMIGTWIVVMVLALVALIVALVVMRKTKKA